MGAGAFGYGVRRHESEIENLIRHGKNTNKIREEQLAAYEELRQQAEAAA